MSRIILKDRVTPHDTSLGGLYGEMIFGKGKHIVPFIDPYGNKSFRTEFDEITYRDHNVVPIGGYQFVFSKLFNIGLDKETTLRVGDLNDEAPQMKIGVPRAEYESIFYDSESSINNPNLNPITGVNISAMNYIFGFMIGDGGSREDNITAIAPNYRDRVLYRPVPFRMSNDGFPFQEGKYFGKIKSFPNNAGESITSYYVKRFDDPKPHIVHSYVTDNMQELQIVDDTVFASTSSIPIESYVEMNISVSEFDGRGFFTTTESTSRINEFGLVSGWFNPDKQDYEMLRLITHFTRPSISLIEGDSIEGVYRLYAR